jgi:hypothetical protein
MFKLEESTSNHNINVDLQKEAKNIVLEEMEKMGLIAKMKAQIKSSVLKILEKQKQGVKQNLEFDYLTPLHRQNKNKEILLAYHVIKEFLQFYEMEYSLPIFENESNIRENVKRETLLGELSMKNNPVDENKPILVQLINNYIQDVNSKKNVNMSQKLDESYGLRGGLLNADIHSVNEDFSKRNENASHSPSINIGNLPTGMGVGKKTLIPISFTNKSIDLKENTSDSSKNSDTMKFNTANINEIYSNSKINTGSVQQDISEKNKDGSDLNTSNNSKDSPTKENVGFYFNTNEYTTHNKYDEEFSEVIMEDIPEVKFTLNAKNDEIEDSKKSLTANSTSNFAFDSSVSNYILNEFDHVEDVEIPK